MTDIKQDDKKVKAKDEYNAFLKKEMDTMFDKPLSEDELDTAVIQEVGTIFGEMTAINEFNSEINQNAIEDLSELKKVEKEVDDVKKLTQLREDLASAA